MQQDTVEILKQTCMQGYLESTGWVQCIIGYYWFMCLWSSKFFWHLAAPFMISAVVIPENEKVEFLTHHLVGGCIK